MYRYTLRYVRVVFATEFVVVERVMPESVALRPVALVVPVPGDYQRDDTQEIDRQVVAYTGPELVTAAV